MTLQRRLIIAVLLAAPLAWLLTVGGTYWRAQHEIDELYDTDMLRLAEQTLAVAALIPPQTTHRGSLLLPLPPDSGDARHGDLAVAIWRGHDDPLVFDEHAIQFARNDGLQGFVDSTVNGVPWRLYYLASGDTRVAVGQRMGEREDLAVAYIASQIVPWLLGLPVLIAFLILAVRRALRPVRVLSNRLESRRPDDGTPLPENDVPGELRMLVQAINGLLERVASLIDQERRLTADAAHELRTPLAALRAQWEVLQRAPDAALRNEAQSSVTRGLERLDRLVVQLLTLARLDENRATAFKTAIDWPSVVEQAVGDCLWVANRRDIDISVEWPNGQANALPIAGDANGLTIMLKNLLDNAIRYGPRHSRVRLVLSSQGVHVDDEGAGIAPDVLGRLGERFVRAAGNEEPGSGLGVSIAQRIARNHGLAVRYEMRERAVDFASGLRVSVVRSSA
ncbi:ATP-binding protein [Bordetella bronchiseptica]|uniref:ATP-binding protein n=1 Tax=Bordetella bronchiseptica TaxID=518 RepID=UPI000459A574|nr:ATP-binding protein [Bordetella bronchiseptica]KCV58021.1 putative sensor protein QseC [Bordetella bronchiseptica 7E71]